ncbi:MAG: glutathione peroxidase [Saprospiraceae bacterium]
MQSNSIHKFRIAGIDGKEIDFAAFAGKKIMVVNVASECGYTPQYQQLQELYDNYQDRLVIVGCPCNDFGGQEPGTEQDIQNFCTIRYGVTFPLTQKVSIKGNPPSDLYRFLTNKSENGVSDSTVKWNFHKYLLDENGQLLQSFPSSVAPLDDPILNSI